MSGNEAISWRKISQGKAKVDEVYTWNKEGPEDHTEAELLADLNEVYHRYGRYPSQWGYWALGPRPQRIRAPFRVGQGGLRPYIPRYNTPRLQNTTVANQAYTFYKHYATCQYKL